MRRRTWVAMGLLAALSSWTYFFPSPPRLGPLASWEPEPNSTLVFAPHSDDEVLAAGGFLQAMEAQGAAPKVVLVTGGDGFRIGAEAYHLKRFKPELMLQYGRHRIQESRTALATLGIPEDRLTFLGFPDQGLHRLWLECWSAARPCTSPTTRVSAVPYDEARSPGTPYAGEALLGEIMDILREQRPRLVV
ncbi:MAG TPA: PIG-L family deacetylase, partial [Symbiobacteriaceae bacterium]|nr:PIG-L family deacetylase [Symbiobacteriaceae bacterium]